MPTRVTGAAGEASLSKADIPLRYVVQSAGAQQLWPRWVVEAPVAWREHLRCEAVLLRGVNCLEGGHGCWGVGRGVEGRFWIPLEPLLSPHTLTSFFGSHPWKHGPHARGALHPARAPLLFTSLCRHCIVVNLPESIHTNPHALQTPCPHESQAQRLKHP